MLQICSQSNITPICYRYIVKVTEDNHLVSLQLNTSKSDVYIKLQVLDHEEEVVSAVGKGHVVLPSFIFQRDSLAEEVEKRPSSRGCKWAICYTNLSHVMRSFVELLELSSFYKFGNTSNLYGISAVIWFITLAVLDFYNEISIKKLGRFHCNCHIGSVSLFSFLSFFL